MINYNICFIKRGSEILLLNRERSSWMGCWNGIGGKLEPGESPRESMIREIAEETQLADYRLYYKGLVSWTGEDERLGGMYLYLAELPPFHRYDTPVKTAEGILDWKTVDWIVHPDNAGIARNIPHYLHYVLEDDQCYRHHCTFESGYLLRVSSEPLDAATEGWEAMERHLLHSYTGSRR